MKLIWNKFGLALIFSKKVDNHDSSSKITLGLIIYVDYYPMKSVLSIHGFTINYVKTH